MKNITLAILAVFICGLFLAVTPAGAQGTAFTYHGNLLSSGLPATGTYDFQFQLFDSATVGTGSSYGSPNPNNLTGIGVTNGLFLVTNDFGANVFTGQTYWLQISVRPTGGGSYTILANRQQLTPTPYAIWAENAAVASAVSNSSITASALNTAAPSSGQVLSFDGTNLSWTTLNSGLTLPYSGGVPPCTSNSGPAPGTLFTLSNSCGTAAVFLGAVGIGTSNPSNTLEVNGGITADSSVTVGSSTTEGTLVVKSPPLAGSASVTLDSTYGGVTVVASSVNPTLGGYVNLEGEEPSLNLNGSSEYSIIQGYTFEGSLDIYDRTWDYTALTMNTDEFESYVQVNGELIAQSANVDGAMIVGGNVGIGTTSPTDKLDVSGGIRATGATPPTSGTGVELDYNGAGDNYGRVFCYARPSNGFIGLGLGDYTDNRGVLILPNGRVGIGTINPDAMLSVNGSADKAGGGSWGTFSDARLKDVGANFVHGLEALDDIQPVHYHYKPGNPLKLPSEPDYVGVVAQQVQSAIPEAVERNQDGYLVVNNDPIIWTMFNAIKELNQKREAEAKDKDAELEKLKGELSQLKEIVARLAAEKKGTAQ